MCGPITKALFLGCFLHLPLSTPFEQYSGFLTFSFEWFLGAGFCNPGIWVGRTRCPAASVMLDNLVTGSNGAYACNSAKLWGSSVPSLFFNHLVPSLRIDA